MLGREIAKFSPGSPSQGCQVWSFRGQKKEIWQFFKLVGLEIFLNLLSSWLLFQSIEVNIAKSKIFLFLKHSLAFFSYKHLATLHPARSFPSTLLNILYDLHVCVQERSDLVCSGFSLKGEPPSFYLTFWLCITCPFTLKRLRTVVDDWNLRLFFSCNWDS